MRFYNAIRTYVSTDNIARSYMTYTNRTRGILTKSCQVLIPLSLYIRLSSSLDYNNIRCIWQELIVQR